MPSALTSIQINVCPCADFAPPCRALNDDGDERSRSESQALPTEGDLTAANLSNSSAPVSGDGSVGRRKFHAK